MKRGNLKQVAAGCIVLGALGSISSASANELCDLSYEVVNDWGSGATHRINVTYHGPDTSGWQLTWNFSGNENIQALWGGSVQQEGNAVTVSDVFWNERLTEGSVIRVGFNINNPSGEGDPQILFNGLDCNGAAPEPTPEPDPVPEPTPDPTPDPEPEPNPQELDWSLDTEQSFLNFVTYKNTNKVETHTFDQLSGQVSNDGNARLDINLDSVNTNNNTRNQRMRDMLFETALYGKAVVTLNVDPQAMSQLQPGQRTRLDVIAGLQLHGIDGNVNTSLYVQRLSDTRFMVQNISPVLIKAADYALGTGIEALRDIAGLNAIGHTVPVDFTLYFETTGE